ncbi:transient receptor potential cation channel trpm isoform X6 [Diorhabda sublineata]|uniref:transient receptor potential cation channel trpm isoform X6 n=1 Tax=Diorhabda sublineata TaxID=1163346 RepID=UPI0024E18FFB|nr:transient receptor potential cation channel trpm isoform X6 [Diorhabda sublineata]XP_056632798.1 transient receptor potential cation channel trpm isoform X6 [Diorhabda sublineata]
MKKSKLHTKTRRHGIFDSLVTSLSTFLWPVANDLRPTAPTRSWIEATFYKRECSRYIRHTKDPLRCCCGRVLEQHKPTADTQPPQPGELWYPSKCTIASPTDAYGILEFQGGPHPSKAQYIRVAHDTKPEYLMQLITREWNLELPKLLISIQGGKANFELQPKLKKVLRKGLLKAARSTGAWIFTGGTNTGVTKHVGDALLLERSQRTGRVNTLGIAPWGIVENNQDLIGQHTEVPYHSISSPRSKNAALNNRHAYFLLVDNGTVGKYGAEIILRRKLEKYISKQRLYPFTQSPIPIVCLVIEGGTNTIRAVLEYVTDEPPVPVVVCDGSGRAADIIAFMCKYECSVLKSMKEYIIATIQRAFEVAAELAEGLFTELMQCVENKHLITVFRIADKYDQKPQELDQIILTALFKSQHLSPTEQLSLALTWNRADIARSEIFVYGQEWPAGALEDAMIKALEHDRCDFVKLLLENGVSMRKFLTIPRLENLYNSKQGPSNTLGYILRDVRPHIPPGYVYTLHDIGLVINKLMGGAYRALYTRRKFRPIYAKIMNKGHSMANTSGRNLGALGLIPGCIPGAASPCLFDYPFNELLIWAVLMKRHKMALLMWQHGEEALAKALVACKLYKAMAHEAAEDDMETEVYEELRAYGKEFENIALEVLDYCYRQDDDQTQQLLTCELQNWSGHTCLSLAVSANHRALLAHPCSQIILADLWMGGLRTRKNTNIKVILGLLCMPYIFKLEFKSKEELQLMPQTTEEHMELENDDDDDKSDSEKNQDADVSRGKSAKTPKRTRSLSIRNKSPNPTGVKALLTENFITRDTVVQQNGGKLIPDFDDEKFKQFNKGRELKMKKKLYEFYTAPITKFWSNSIAYLAFLVLFSFTILVKMEHVPNWQEIFATAFILSLGCEKLRELFSSEPVGISQKFAVWSWNMWNPSDMAAVFMFMVGMSLRYQTDKLSAGRVIYCTNCIYWYLRILNILSVNKYLGPLVTMMGKMVKNMIYFIVLLLIILMSFGVARQAILKPNEPPTWSLARDVFFEPYFMLYGEVFADEIDPPCGGEDEEVCVPGRWISPVIMSMYLLVANILLINLLIAVFNNIFNEVNAIAHQVWMFQRFTVVMEYEQKPLLPPPFIIFSHLYLVLKYLKRKLEGIEESYDNGLKLFLDKDEMERLYDFEEDCVEGYFAEQENKLQQSTEERIKITTERIEHLTQKVEDIVSKENLQTTVLQNLDVRTRRYTEQMQDLIDDVDAVKQSIEQNQTDYPVRVSSSRQRTISEQSELSEDNTIVGQTVQSNRKKMVVRSLTEVRPDAYIFDNGQHIEYRYADEDEETEQLDNISVAGSVQQQQQPNLLRQRTRSTESKESSESDKKNDEILIDDVARFNSEILKARATQKRRDSTGTIRRGSESGTVIACDLRPPFLTPKSLSFCHIFRKLGEDSQHSSKPSLPKRQFSQTQSEPETTDPPAATLPTSTISLERSVTFTEPKIKVIPPVSSRSALLMHMHTEYTSITDELESVCGLFSPPKSPGLLSPPRPEQSPPSTRKRNPSEMSNPEIALNLEKEHLRSAEESDYMVMENLIQRRYSEEDEEIDDDVIERPAGRNPTLLKVVTETREFRVNSWPVRGALLQRSSAVEEPPTPIRHIGSSSSSTDRQDSTESSDNTAAAINQFPMPQRPSIVIDSSQLPTLQREALPTAESKGSLHMQSETMC